MPHAVERPMPLPQVLGEASALERHLQMDDDIVDVCAGYQHLLDLLAHDHHGRDLVLFLVGQLAPRQTRAFQLHHDRGRAEVNQADHEVVGHDRSHIGEGVRDAGVASRPGRATEGLGHGRDHQAFLDQPALHVVHDAEAVEHPGARVELRLHLGHEDVAGLAQLDAVRPLPLILDHGEHGEERQDRHLLERMRRLQQDRVDVHGDVLVTTQGQDLAPGAVGAGGGAALVLVYALVLEGLAVDGVVQEEVLPLHHRRDQIQGPVAPEHDHHRTLAHPQELEAREVGHRLLTVQDHAVDVVGLQHELGAQNPQVVGFVGVPQHHLLEFGVDLGRHDIHILVVEVHQRSTPLFRRRKRGEKTDKSNYLLSSPFSL